jgi:hypothetical protein
MEKNATSHTMQTQEARLTGEGEKQERRMSLPNDLIPCSYRKL